MAEEKYECKYKQIYEKDSNCNVFNDPHFSGPVTINAGQKPEGIKDDKTVKKAIEQLFADKTVTTDNQWYAIRRVLCEKNIAPQKLEDFLGYIDGLKLENVLAYNNGNVNKVGQRYTRLAVKVSAWNTLQNPSDAEQRQIMVAQKLMELLQ